MSYQVLARKWRPTTFQDMVGQEHVLKALIHALDHERLHHAYLFTGTRGVGKTTIGRLLARCLNCEQGISSNPCGECDSCLEIRDGRFVDLIEIDAASRTKVEDMRELLDNVQYAPTRGRYKIYLIDEVHMLSGHSFNALLKTLEEPPEHVKFLLATTDPQKLPVTILSRCLQFNLKRMTHEHIVGHLSEVLGQEGIDFEEAALWSLARAADGSMRDALSLTDQAIAFGNERLNAADVSTMLGTIDQRDIWRLVSALASGDGAGMLGEIDRVAAFSPDYAAILADMLSVFHRVTLEQVVPGSTDNAMGDADAVRDLASRLSGEDAQLFYQAALIGRQDLSVTPDARMGFEMALLRMLAFRPGSERREPPAGGSGQSEGGSKDPEADEPAPAAVSQAAEPAPQSEPVPQSEPEPEPEPAPPPPLEAADDAVSGAMEEPAVAPPMPPEEVPQVAPEPETIVDSRPDPAPAGAVEDDASPSPDSAEPLQESESFYWPRDFYAMGLKGMAGSLASEGALALSDHEATLTLSGGHVGLLTDRHRDRIRDALSDYTGKTIALTVQEGEPGEDTPARYNAAQKAARQEAAEAAISSDPHVQRIVERFDGRIIDGSTVPLERQST
ncbi:DNA polymerase III subunit gamma/tau [Tamilnaduibacter salinus]|uniref:DNA polymerase III subunit gamma/tau n=1 Tax=Tamilnaduibacter salinus TaxID=1484056 RepID=A0A2A2I6W8_9GAMM|nr:DNA polymerase III subunit gamma/tau [Tamilnaduibacter salinus]PAV27024.1 DNA polymerase III subunit gamma/tau [Tamilnaduibacter salinus]